MARKSKAKSQKKSGRAKVSGIEIAPVLTAEDTNENIPGQATEIAGEQESANQKMVVSELQPALGDVADQVDRTDGEKQPEKAVPWQLEAESAQAEADKPCLDPSSVTENRQELKNSIDLGKGRKKDQEKNSVEDGKYSGQKQSVSVDEETGSAKKANVPGNGHVSRTVCAILAISGLVLGIFIGTLIPQGQAYKASGVDSHLEKGEPSGQSASASPESAEKITATNAKEDNVPPMPRELAKKMTELEKAVVANPADAGLWTSLGNLYFDSGQSKKAIDAYEKSLSLAPGNPDIMTDLGIMYRESGDYEKAVAQFRAASAVVPAHQNALFNEGVVLFYDMGQKDAAIVAWQKLLKVNPQAKGPDGQSVSEMIKHLH